MKVNSLYCIVGPARRFTQCLLSLSLFSYSLLSLSAFPEDPVIEKAYNLEAQGHFRAAEALYNAFLKTTPNNVNALIALGLINSRKYRFKTAEKFLNKALSYSPQPGESLCALASTYEKQIETPFQRENDAELVSDASGRLQRTLLKLEGINPESPCYLDALGTDALHRNEPFQAQKTFQKLITLSPQSPTGYLGLGKAFMLTSRLAQAQERILHAYDLAPHNPEVILTLATLLGQNNQPDRALQYTLEASRWDDSFSPDREFLLGTLYTQLGKREEALAAFERIEQNGFTHAPTRLKIAQLAEKLGESEKSTQFYRLAFLQNPDLLEEQLQAAENSLRSEQTQEAIGRFEGLMKLLPTLDGLAQQQAWSIRSLHGLAATIFQAKLSGLKTAPPSETTQPPYTQIPRVPLIQLDLLKLNPEVSKIPVTDEKLRSEITTYQNTANPLAAGEAYFLLASLAEAHTQWESIECETAESCLLISDRLFADHDLHMAEILYRRTQALGDERISPVAGQALRRIAQKHKQAEQWVKQGDAFYASKDYFSALTQYNKAIALDLSWESPFLRSGDAYEKLKDRYNAFKAYQRAVWITPGLLSSKPFSKKYKKLSTAKAQPIKKKKA